MSSTSIEKSAKRLRWVIGLLWVGLLLVYVAGRIGFTGGPLRIQALGLSGEPGSLLIAADISLLVLTVALLTAALFPTACSGAM